MPRIRSSCNIGMLSLTILICLPLCLSGCAMVQSSARNQPEPNAIGYNLPKGLVHLVVKPKESSTDNYEIAFNVINVPDENYLYTLKYHPKPTFEDTINIQVGPNGLLKSISTTSIDRMPEIVQKLAELVPTALKQFIPAVSIGKLKHNIKSIDVIFDPDDPPSVEKFKTRFKDELGATLEVEQLFGEQQYREPPDSHPSGVY